METKHQTEELMQAAYRLPNKKKWIQ